MPTLILDYTISTVDPGSPTLRRTTKKFEMFGTLHRFDDALDHEILEFGPVRAANIPTAILREDVALLHSLEEPFELRRLLDAVKNICSIPTTQRLFRVATDRRP